VFPAFWLANVDARDYDGFGLALAGHCCGVPCKSAGKCWYLVNAAGSVFMSF